MSVRVGVLDNDLGIKDSQLCLGSVRSPTHGGSAQSQLRSLRDQQGTDVETREREEQEGLPASPPVRPTLTTVSLKLSQLPSVRGPQPDQPGEQ